MTTHIERPHLCLVDRCPHHDTDPTWHRPNPADRSSVTAHLRGRAA